MSTTDELTVALRPVVETLERLGAQYRIGGSVASSALGLPRSTLDIDLVTDLNASQVAPFVSSLEADYYVEAGAVRDAVRRRASFNLIHLATMLKVDVFIAKEAPFDRTSFARHTDRALGDGPGGRLYAFRSPEDVILRKLEWYRLGGEVSDRQWSDAVGVLKVQAASLDYTYLEHWADVLRIADLLRRAREQASTG